MSTLPESKSSLTGISVPARFSIEQFDEMVSSGVLSDKDDKRYQLFRGEIRYMTPPNPLHDDVLALLTDWAFSALASVSSPTDPLLQIRNQGSLDLRPGNSVVMPDLMLVTKQDYSSQRPQASDCVLAIEVSDSSRTFDLHEKCELYALSGVKEYWVVDIPNRCLIVHRSPAGNRYGSIETYDERTEVHPEAVPSIGLFAAILFQ